MTLRAPSRNIVVITVTGAAIYETGAQCAPLRGTAMQPSVANASNRCNDAAQRCKCISSLRFLPRCRGAHRAPAAIQPTFDFPIPKPPSSREGVRPQAGEVVAALRRRDATLHRGFYNNFERAREAPHTSLLEGGGPPRGRWKEFAGAGRRKKPRREVFDMYPQYWTPGIGGIFMRYSYEYKKMCVELYRQGKWVETPEGVKEKNFRNMIQIWARTEESCGVEALRHKNQNKVWTAEEKYELVAKVLAGESNRTTAIAAGIDKGLLYSWVRCYKMKGYQGLVAQRQGRPPKEPDMRKKIEPTELTPSEREEMIRLRAENERLRAEIAVVKKEIALREERCAAQLKAKKLRSSKSSTKKDIN